MNKLKTKPALLFCVLMFLLTLKAPAQNGIINSNNKTQLSSSEFLPKSNTGINNLNKQIFQYYDSCDETNDHGPIIEVANSIVSRMNVAVPVNDLPCNAILAPLGAVVPGNNVNATSGGEPTSPYPAQCQWTGTVNTVWFKAVIPASGSLDIRTHSNPLDTQIEAFLFPGGCGAAASNNTRLGCNNDGIACLVGDGGFHEFSELILTGLSVGDTLFVAVDGNAFTTGSFDITFIDGATTAFPPVYQQDCELPQTLCNNNNIVVADPGFRNTGNICDLAGGVSCWGIGERNSAWYRFTVDPSLSGGIATISFDITSDSLTDIDFLIWDITGQSNVCSSIQSLSLTPASCNYYPQFAITGLSLVGTGSPASSYSPSIVFSGAPRTYLMLINDFNNAGNAGFTLNWGTTPISSATTTSVWTGATDNLFTTSSNWGNCGTTPDCGIDAFINSTSNGRQPIVTAGATKSVHNIIINAGASLTLQANATLKVCGDFTNYGSLICNPGSTIEFTGTGVQTINGFLTGTNSFGNLVVTKNNGSVLLTANIDVKENFITTNNTSVFNISGKYMKVGGDFLNANGIGTFTGIGRSTVEFYKSIMQTFTNTSGSIRLNRVVMKKPAGRVSLIGGSSKMNIDSTLTLTSGIITTRSSNLLEVNVKYYLPAAITGHNPSSYIDGLLRRKISNGSSSVTGTYDFPVGNIVALGGYELATIEFTTPTTIPNITSIFNTWAGSTPAQGPVASDCIVATYSTLPIFNNGYWAFKRSNSIADGNYNIALHNVGENNILGIDFTVAKADDVSDPLAILSWGLLGDCDLTSTPSNTRRNNINPGPSAATSFNHFYATVQTGTILPIELLFFNAQTEGQNVKCKWETSSETNNEYFEVERSFNGKEFFPIGKVSGFGLGTSTESRTYSLIDDDVCNDIRYYRLKQVDIDGNYSYSDVVAIDCSSDKKRINIYPNPAESKIFCTFYENKNSSLTFQWRDILGKVIKEEITSPKGTEMPRPSTIPKVKSPICAAKFRQNRQN